MNRQGFTFIEVLVAMLIFTMASLAAVSIVTGAVRATKDSKEITQASWLLQNLMAETESRLEAQGVDKACKEKETGKFPSPYERFTWKSECYKIDFHLSEAAAKLQQEIMAKSQGQSVDESEKDKEDPMIKLVMQVASEYMTRSTREVHVEVSWPQGKGSRTLDATMHFVRFDQKPAIPSIGGGTSPSPTPTPNPSGTN